TESGRLNGLVGPSTATFFIRLRFDGECEERIGKQSVVLGKEWALVQSPGDIAVIQTGERSDILGITIGLDVLRSELESRLQRNTNAGLRFEPGMNLRSQFGKAFTDEVFKLCAELGTNGTESLSVRQMQHSLISLLMEGHRHNYTRLFHRDSAAGPWQVRATEEFIRANADLPLSLGDLAMVSGVSSRALQFSFQKHRGCSPMQFFHNVRLERARAELLTATEGATVTSVATKWGFGHFGRFAADYMRLYAEAPSVTLRRSRAEIE
ncbi:MAG: AraC family transcriptional regulator, partial [Acidobacteria bacterium]|nr:AraC family transcriptional regulator [Acidobacteriota bacterium]